VTLFQDHSPWSFLDWNYLVNKETLLNRSRACPLTGQVPAIPVSGDFRETYDLFAIILTDLDKPYKINYMIKHENGFAASFVAFIEYLIGNKLFFHKKSWYWIMQQSTLVPRLKFSKTYYGIWLSVEDH
jgi:hypothetical protein